MLREEMYAEINNEVEMKEIVKRSRAESDDDNNGEVNSKSAKGAAN